MSDLFDLEKLAEGYLSYQPIRGNACRKVPVQLKLAFEPLLSDWDIEFLRQVGVRW